MGMNAVDGEPDVQAWTSLTFLMQAIAVLDQVTPQKVVLISKLLAA